MELSYKRRQKDLDEHGAWMLCFVPGDQEGVLHALAYGLRLERDTDLTALYVATNDWLPTINIFLSLFLLAAAAGIQCLQGYKAQAL
jgi:hypothetical protein